jgi:hypothetical protein
MKFRNGSRRGPVKSVMPWAQSTTSPTGVFGGVMIVPEAVRSVAATPVSCSTCTYCVPSEPIGKVARNVRSST